MAFQLERQEIHLKPEHVQLYLTHILPIIDSYVGKCDTKDNRRMRFDSIKSKLRELGYPRQPKITHVSLKVTIGK